MRVGFMPIKACELGVDNFIYLPKKKSFIFVDDIDRFENHIIVYFELGLVDNGFEEIKIKFKNDEIVHVVSEFIINPSMLFKERMDIQKSNLESIKEDINNFGTNKKLEDKLMKTKSDINKIKFEIAQYKQR
jgi:hypothetical protein